MQINFDEVLFSDFHIHSRFSRACSTNINFENLVKWAKIKGLNLLGTGDFTHPLWLKEIKEKLTDEGNGFYYYDDFPFIITGEISLVYTQNRGRRIHLVLLVPNLETAEKINLYLDTRGRRDYDGRPIFNIPGDEFVREMMTISEEIEIIPAHIWTPWFGIFGSMSGFDSLKECFKEQIGNIHAIETGMSSDPEMNWRIKELENIAIVSFSDAHSFWPFRLGREATIFRKVNSYSEIIKQIRNKDFIGTVETDPAYGKYHWDGHRTCLFSCSPEESGELNEICPVCKKHLTIGVENRVGKLASFPEGHRTENAKFFYKVLPLQEIISLFLGTAIETKSCWNLYNSLIENFGNEFNILLNVSKEEFLGKNIDEKLIELILRNREEKIKVKPGFDGEYGKAMIGEKQSTLI
ncbi:MAG: endonuclease Q family protein [Candidatus Nanoarchaeia archaeon]|nr:endonuclease Q family protein [Candidatus Nanoarchaeia archaeon]MDD5358482.1 endonuclease Q family protein [Candidatus Nanoarchaeia archaeon]MDD5588996.1 endonuclease Q family protein [Candidatus Nanoarchaeia archaeon]